MSPFWRNTALSAALHAAIILGLLLASVLSFHRRQPQFPDPLVVTMVNLPPDAGAPAAPPPPKPPPKAIPDPPKKTPPPKTPPKPPDKKPTPPKPPDRPKLTPRDLERLLQDALAPTTPAAAAPADDLQWYYRLVYQALYDAWQQPGMLSRSAGLTTTVLIRVQRDGTISQRSLLRSSGNSIMDQSVMDAVRSVTRLQPLPPAWGGLHKDISIDFLLTDASL
jgi:protein TonB